MAYKRMRYGRKTSRFFKRAYKKRSYKRKGGFKARVKRTVRRMAENKQYSLPFVVRPFCLSNNTQSLSDNVLTCSPSSGTQQAYSINLGAGNANRIGNRVTTRRLVLKYQINASPYDATTNVNPRPVHVRMLFVKSKLEPSSNLLAGQIIGAGAGGGRLFEQSQTTTGFMGSLQDLTRKVSSDSYTYLTQKTLKLGFSVYGGTEGAGGVPAVQANQYFANNDFKLSRYGKVDLTKWCPKTIKWNDAGDVNSPWIFCILQVVAADGTSFGLSEKPVLANFEYQYVYEDM